MFLLKALDVLIVYHIEVEKAIVYFLQTWIVAQNFYRLAMLTKKRGLKCGVDCGIMCAQRTTNLKFR